MSRPKSDPLHVPAHFTSDRHVTPSLLPPPTSLPPTSLSPPHLSLSQAQYVYLPHPLWSLATAARVVDPQRNVPNTFEGLGEYVYHNGYATVSGLGPTACAAALPLLKVRRALPSYTSSPYLIPF